ncbi:MULTISPECIES: SAM-dependent methyltransferase [Streptacidiphilus]|uniref:SAM-dependent methyltransferase n=1 Tax=Streptacidiphilus cavernicola TaxID=3342716 RepID=A0ABV6UKM0_9ACTN
MTEDRTWMQGTDERAPSADLHPEVAHPARVYDVWLGGKDNFASDRAVAEQLATMTPHVVNAARANRAFLGRAVRTVSALGVSQFLDIGTGIPAAGNTLPQTPSGGAPWWPSGPTPPPGSPTSTTTRSCSPTPGR